MFPVAYAAPVSAEQIAGDTASQLGGLVEIIVVKIPLFIAAFIVLVLFYLLARIGRNMVENKLEESGLEQEHQEVQILGGRIAFATILILGITIALKIAGIDLTAIIAAAAFGVGFALRDMIMNFLAGIMILVGRHFSIGDFISVDGTLGKVIEIQSRVTILQAIDGTKVIVPNAKIFNSKVISMTSNPFRRIEVEVGVDYRANLENAIKLCINVAENTQGVLLEPKPTVLVSEWGDYEIVLKVRAWVESRSGWLKAKSLLYRNLKKAYDEYNINYAWPIAQVVMDKDLQPDSKETLFDPAKPVRQLIDSETPKIPVLGAQPAPSSQTPSAPATPISHPEEIDVAETKPLAPLSETKL